MKTKLTKELEHYIFEKYEVGFNILNVFDWESLPGINNKSNALRMSIVHALGEMNYNQEKLLETRGLNWDDVEYNKLFKEIIEIQRKL